MENRRYNLRPLPGGRRGTSGANAGCDSMRTIGDGGLNRRAPLEEYATADNHHPSYSDAPSSTSSYRPSTSSPTKSISSSVSCNVDVVQEAITAIHPGPTTCKSSTRKKWTSDMNEFILRTYLQLTNLETDLSSYLEPLHTKFIEKYPNMDVSRQRIGDQRRAIVRRKLLNESKMNQIHKEVEDEINAIHSYIPSSIALSNTTQVTVTPGNFTNNTTQLPYNPSSQNTKTRMRWSNQINETILSIYYEATELESNLTAYRKTLHDKFIQVFPNLNHISEQRLSDQKRVIINNKMVSDKRTQEIKEEVKQKLSSHTQRNSQSTTNNLSHETNHLETEPDNFDPLITSNPYCLSEENLSTENTQENFNTTQINPTPNNITNSFSGNKQKLDDLFYDAINKFINIEPTCRPYLPKQKTSVKLASIVNYINTNILPKYLTMELNFNSVHLHIYAAAYTAVVANGGKIAERTSHICKSKPAWQKRLEQKIGKYRKDIGRLTQYIQGNRSKRIVAATEQIKLKYHTHAQYENANMQPEHFLDTLKQKLSASSRRLKRYLTCTDRKKQNSKFTNNEKAFYRTLGSENNPTNTTAHISLTAENMRQFWAETWESPGHFQQNAEWIKDIEEKYMHTTEMEFIQITVNTFKQAINKTHNWKAPGTDNLHNYWYKKLTSTHPVLYHHLNTFINQPITMPQFLTHGVTYMIPKDPKNLDDPSKYRPITCLQTFYKILTSCLAETIYNHLNKNNILAEQQKGCRKNSQGCKEQLTLDAIVLNDAYKTKQDIHTMFVDYRKAFDSVPHDWLLKVMNIYKIHPTLISFLQFSMQNWITKLQVNQASSVITTEPIRIMRGIYQGDALSPLWFCIALNPVSELLNKSNLGYKLIGHTHYTLSHLLYMDDIKLYASSIEDLYQLANITESFSKDINMQF